MPTRKPSKYGNNRFNPSTSTSRSKTPYKSSAQTISSSSLRTTEVSSQDEKLQAVALANSIDESFGFPRFDSGKKRVGWLYNMHSTLIPDSNVPGGHRAGVDFYFLADETGSRNGSGNEAENFKATVEYEPYFLVAVRRGREAEVEEWVKRVFEGVVKSVSRLEKEDLKMPNHLVGYRRTFLKLSFWNVSGLLECRRVVMPIAEGNREKLDAMDTYAEVAGGFDGNGFDEMDGQVRPGSVLDASDFIVDIREYDVPYHVRVTIDLDIRIGKWYTVEAKHGVISLRCIEERVLPADPVILAFDIETTKLPLKFPDAVIDQVMMISYMIDGQGFLITNREIVSEDISDFDYTPRAEYEGPFLVFNEPDERGVIERFFEHIKEARPTVIATYNGDFFDWPFVEARASVLGIDMYREIGFRKNSEDIYESDHCVHLDCFAWVNRDSYLPQGSRGLKAVTVAKLGYDPDELDPELMLPYASEHPQILAEYSVSDAVATYYLYMKYVHPFIFSLCTILPLNPNDTLRKGTGTLCEMLLMVQAYKGEIVLPNKHKEPREAFWEGHLLDSETYVGGHVESIEAGVFRADIPVNFAIDTAAIDELIRDLDDALRFCITVEEKKDFDDVTNYDEVRQSIVEKLVKLKKDPNRSERPLIYHLDVASMYPNIMTTNRLQPDSMIKESDCAACDFNRPGKTCDRRLPWAWRGEFLPTKRDEYNMIKRAMVNEKFPGKKAGTIRMFEQLSLDEQAVAVKKRLQDYSKKIYHKIHDSKTIEREAIICQRENPFYVNTVRDFRDRRYDYKGKQKTWKGKVEQLKGAGAAASEVEDAKKMVITFDSMQLAHKVILNSFYGYVMRKGSRWYSMEMAGVTCLTGAHIIQMARELVERIGRPLELDTDGIWCMLPATFPENVVFTLKNGKKMAVSYPCVMLNHLVHAKFTNDQYQTLKDPKTFRYETHKDNSIFFEVDGPYKAMILPTSQEEDKNLKKRYAVFNHDGTLAELKGFEVKRRGELKLIKIFQTQLFKVFLEGTTLEETYKAVARIADRWLDVLDQHGSTMADEELIDLICENKSMTKTLEEYGAQKSTSITTAKRLAEFLGEQMIKDKGLNCKYIISSKPKNTPVTERAVPVAIFSAEESTKRYFLRKWLKDDPQDMDPRNVIDWEYYRDRLGSVIQKLITIPAALQKMKENPVPRIEHPDWLRKRIAMKEDKFQQRKLNGYFQKRPLGELDVNILDRKVPQPTDMEDMLEEQSKTQQSPPQQQQNKRKAQDKPAPADPFAALPDNPPSIEGSYTEWLKYQKQKWKIQKQARARRRQLFGEKPNSGSDALTTMFRAQAETTFMDTWQILQLRDGDSPGEVNAFILLGQKIHTLKIKVPRVMYLNLKADDLPNVEIPDCEVEKVNHTLPNGHPSVHLFQITMPEATYQYESESVSALVEHPSVEGVYERQLPLHVRALLKVGNMCGFDKQQPGILGRGLEQGFDLDTLLRNLDESSYVPDKSAMSYMHLYHVAVGDRQVFALFSTARQDAQIIIQSPAKDSQGMPNVGRIYTEQNEQRQQQDNASHGIFEYQDKVNFNVSQTTTRRKTILQLADTVKKWKKEESRPTMLLMQSSQHAQIIHDVKVLADYPVLNLPSHESDSDLPPLAWQSFVLRRIVAHYFTLESWLAHLLELARYGDVPLCNLQQDDPRFLIDLAYARRLQRSNIILWWSPNPRPDHAGHEKDDVTSALTDVVEMPQINNAGAYTSVCVDVSLQNLTINTILTSSIINDLENTGDAVTFNPEPDTLDTDHNPNLKQRGSAGFAQPALQVLRDMVKAWWTEACRGNRLADILVQHLVRWVESPSSNLYDANLKFYIQMMSKKAFQQLITDFRRVGSNVIFASPTRLLLQTSKQDVANAYAYINYILKSIQQKPLFHFLGLEIKDYWDVLLWYDSYNYGGRGCNTIDEGTSDASLETVMHWQLAQFLPLPLQPVFSDWVVEFIEVLGRLKRPGVSGGGSQEGRATQLPNQGHTFLSITDDPNSMEVTSVLADNDFSKPLKKQITGLIRRQREEMLHPELATDWAFPELVGGSLASTSDSNGTSKPNSRDQTRDPILELVKSLTQILSLYKPLNLETRLLKKELLSLFDIREFSNAAKFSNPSDSLRFENLICEGCTQPRSLDLCRDEDVLPETVVDENGGREIVQKAFRCANSHCDTTFSRVLLEQELIGRIERMVMQWTCQDLQCVKCGMLMGDDMVFAEHCTKCGGAWGGVVGEVERRRMKDEVRSMERVGGMYGMRMLEGVVGGVRGLGM
ncbi:DNA polymerase epsilon catalytic subunit [Knufia obscura]|uniref:DNA polymerase epsilon catalytic subunit n=1 Tax=Knufia obscura TaxID=1635080 RepID=A0ABR0RGA9_9EURO|nr:DNA polymerase epsilon catalytic subunit [Knufia obscura]